MGIGKLEPLYRYLKGLQTEPMSALIKDINQLAKAGYVHKNPSSDGIVRTIDTTEIRVDISNEIKKSVGDVVEYYTSLQAVDDKLFVSVNRIGSGVNKTILTACIDGNNVPTIEFLESDAFFNGSIAGKTLWTASMALFKTDSGETKTGFIRHESSFKVNPDNQAMAIKIDMKSSRIKPLYLSLTRISNPVDRKIFYGAEAKGAFESMGG